MSNKTSFKRIALALVAALGIGVMNTSTSYAAANTVIDETLTLSASSASIAYGETATLTITNTWIATKGATITTSNSGETQVIHMVADSGGAASVTAILAVQSSDSSNVAGKLDTTAANTDVMKSTKVITFAGTNPYTNVGTFPSTSIVESAISLTAGGYSKQAITVYFYNANPTTSGSTTYTITSRAHDGTIQKSARFTLTTTAPSRTAVAATSKLWLNQATGASPTATTALAQRVAEADSTLVVSAGAAASPAVVGVLHPILNNASDTKTTLAGAVGTSESILVTVTGPGTIALGSSTTRVKSQLVGLGETIVVYSDGTAGTMTLTGSIGGVTLTQAAKTLTFFGKPATITATVDSAVVALGSVATRAVSFTVKDSAGNAIVGSSPKNDNTPGGFFLTVADTKVVHGTQAATGSLAGYTACSYVTALSKWTCDLTLNDSGTVTAYISDSYTQGSAVVNSSALTINVSGAGYTGTITLPKSTYNIGEKAILTVTSKDSRGSNVANGASKPFSGLRWGSTSPTFGAPTGSDANGGNAGGTDGLVTLLNAGGSFTSGVETLVVYMPTVTGTYTLIGTTGASKDEQTLLTFKVEDPAAAANALAIAAAQAAADAAADAAAEAIDAANAATDAANLAAEAADAATVAAEEARDAADAATAAVEELATQVATLMAALKAQITTLANTVAKIAKKVKA